MCRSIVLASHLKFHILNACNKNDPLKQSLIKTMVQSSTVVQSLEQSFYSEYKKNLQKIYNDLHANPETSSMYRVVDHEKKRTREEEGRVELDLTNEDQLSKRHQF